jgi:hypothetical protein
MVSVDTRFSSYYTFKIAARRISCANSYQIKILELPPAACKQLSTTCELILLYANSDYQKKLLADFPNIWINKRDSRE